MNEIESVQDMLKGFIEQSKNPMSEQEKIDFDKLILDTFQLFMERTIELLKISEKQAKIIEDYKEQEEKINNLSRQMLKMDKKAKQIEENMKQKDEDGGDFGFGGDWWKNN